MHITRVPETEPDVVIHLTYQQAVGIRYQLALSNRRIEFSTGNELGTLFQCLDGQL
jgi:hypothetical protein